MKKNLANPKALLEYTGSYHARWAERQKEVSSDREATQKALSRATVQIDRYVTAIGESDEPVEAMIERLNKLEAERAALAEKLRLIEADGNVVALHPAAIDRFATSIAAIHDALIRAGDPSAVAGYRAASATCSTASWCTRPRSGATMK
jgi:chromosome segregation ATPase